MTKSPIRVLLADDDEDDRNFFREALEELKIKTSVHIVNDGQALIDYLSQPGVKVPDILFLDLNMPCKSGVDCLIDIKAMQHLKNIAIAIYSTSGSESDIENTFVKGANVYIKKPSDFNALKKVLSQVITINWQYQTSGLNRDNFLLSI